MYYIYKIENLINGKRYIGLTNNIQRRRARHFTDLECNRHDNHFLQKEFNIYKKENFSFQVLFEGDVDYQQISILEQEYIKNYNSFLEGYNQNEGGNFGPSNGGSKLLKSDILNILSATEFIPRCGGALKDIYDVSNTTIMRIKKGENHSLIYQEYYDMTLEKRKEIFKIFCESNNFHEKNEDRHSLKTKRKLSKEQVFMILANREFQIIPNSHMSKILGVADYTSTLISKRKTYKDFALLYDKLALEEKQKIVSLFSNKQL